MNLADLTTPQLMEKFVNSGLMVEKEIVREIIKRGDSLGYLLNILKEDKYWEVGEEGDAWSPYHTIFILGLIGNDKAFNALKYALIHRVEELGDWLTENVPSILFSFGIKYFDKIKEIAFNESLDMYVRIAAIRALCAFAVVNKNLTEETSKICKQLLKEEKNKELLALVMPEMAEVKDEELFEMIKEFFYKNSKYAKEVTGLKDLTELHEGRSKSPEYTHCTKDLWGHFSKENLDYLYETNYEDVEEETEVIEKFLTQDPVKKTKKIGRNEPCPCGSGKKYKKCCGKIA